MDGRTRIGSYIKETKKQGQEVEENYEGTWHIKKSHDSEQSRSYINDFFILSLVLTILLHLKKITH